MVSQDDVFHYVGIAFLLVVVVAIAMKAFGYQRKILEGMTTTSTPQANVAAKVSSDADKASDALRIDKYRSNYEDTIIELEKVVSMNLLGECVNGAETIAEDPTSTAAQKIIVNANNLKAFRETLNEAMLILDKNRK